MRANPSFAFRPAVAHLRSFVCSFVRSLARSLARSFIVTFVYDEYPSVESASHDSHLGPRRPPQIGFGLWLDRPGHQDGALGHHAGALHDSPGIMQALHDFHESYHAGHPTACFNRIT